MYKKRGKLATEIFVQLGIVLFIAFFISLIARLFKQPIIVGYILAGVVISPFIFNLTISNEIIQVFSHSLLVMIWKRNRN